MPHTNFQTAPSSNTSAPTAKSFTTTEENLEPEGVFNGIRHYRVRILRPIPNYLTFGKILIVLKHQGQKETCRHCNLPGHYAHSCKEEICFNCEVTRHQAPTCPSPTLCSLCHNRYHKARNCPHSWD